MTLNRTFTSQADRAALEERSRRAAQENLEPSKTLQGPAHDADINTIAKAFGLNGKRGAQLPVPPEVFDPRHYADLSDAPDLREVLDLALEAQRQFSRLPVELRSRFNHDPAALWDFVQNPANAPEAVRLGLLVERPPVVAPEPLAPPGNATPA